MNPLRRHRRPAAADPAALPTAPTPAAMAEAVGLVAGRAYGLANLQLSGDVPPIDIIRALLGVAVALLGEQFPDDHGEAFLRLLGADVATHPHGDRL